MAYTTYRKRVSKRRPRKNRDHRGVPQMMVAVSAEPEFGGKPITLRWATKFCNGEGVSARLEAVKREAIRRLREMCQEERAA